MPNLRENIICRLVYIEFLVDWFTAYYNSVARHFGIKPFRPLDVPIHGNHSPQTFCYTKIKVSPKTIRPQDVSTLHVSLTCQAEGHFSPPKDVMHQTISGPIHSGTKTFWPLTFSDSLGRAG